jgi:hypothetical protein
MGECSKAIVLEFVNPLGALKEIPRRTGMTGLIFGNMNNIYDLIGQSRPFSQRMSKA